MSNVAVDVWHADITDTYSAFSNNQNADLTTTFLRGIQITDASGQVEVRTIFPSWYTGRDIHIHFKVKIGGIVTGGVLSGATEIHTGQLFFADQLNTDINALYPYTTNNQQRTTLAADSIATQDGGAGLISDVVMIDSSVGYSAGVIATHTVAVTNVTTPGTSAGTPQASSAPALSATYVLADLMLLFFVFTC